MPCVLVKATRLGPAEMRTLSHRRAVIRRVVIARGGMEREHIILMQFDTSVHYGRKRCFFCRLGGPRSVFPNISADGNERLHTTRSYSMQINTQLDTEME